MATHASAVKRNRQSEKRRTRNRARKSEMRTIEKKVRSAPTQEAALGFLKLAISKIQKAASKGILHRNSASRHVSRLTQFVKKMAS